MLDYQFLYALEGAPFGTTHWTGDRAFPSLRDIDREGSSNAGVGNLARRSIGLCAIGTMSSWWGAYALDGHLYRHGTLYPVGTLLLRAYRGEDDPGHLGILTPRGVIQSTPEGGVGLGPEEESWELVVYHADWLTSS